MNFFSAEDPTLIKALARGEFNLRGLQNKTMRAHRGEKTSGQVSRLLKCLRLHGLVKKIGHSYRYYLTVLGKQVITSGLKLKNLVLIPELATAPGRWTRSPARFGQNLFSKVLIYNSTCCSLGDRRKNEESPDTNS